MANIYSFAGPHTVWSQQDQSELQPYGPARQAGGWGVALGIGAGTYAAGMHTFSDGERGFTKAYRGLQVAERFAMPGGMMATFRLPFFVSPFVQHERIVEATGELFRPHIPASAFHAEGHSLASDIWRGLLQTDEGALRRASREGLDLQRTEGSLWRAVSPSTGEVVKDRIMLGQRGRAREFNRMVQAHLAITSPDLLAQVQGDWELMKYGDPDEIPRRYDHSRAPDIISNTREAMSQSKVRPGFAYHSGASMGQTGIENIGRTLEYIPMHVPTITGHATTDQVIHMARIGGAAGSARLNELIRTLEQQVPVLSDVGAQLPFKLYGKEGSFLQNSFMYSRRAMNVGIAGMLLSSAGWARRHDLVGGAAAFGVAGGYLGSLFGKSKAAGLRGAAFGVVASLLPPFQDGLFSGLGNIGAMFNKMRSYMTNALGPLPIVGSGWRRWFERNLPGATDTSTAIGMGVLAVGVGAIADRRYRNHMMPSVPGLDINRPIASTLKRAHSYMSPYAAQFWNLYNERRGVNEGLKARGLQLSGMQRRFRDGVWAINEISKRSAWRNSVTETLPHLGQIPSWMTEQLSHDSNWARRIVGEKNLVKRVGNQLAAGWLGADAKRVISRSELGDKFWRAGGTRNWRQWSLPFGRPWTMRFASVAAGWSLLTGKLATKETPSELNDIYEGRKLIPMRKGRWWEGGGTAWEGGAISHYKPHWLALSKSRAIEKSVWGEEEGFDIWNPVGGVWHSPIGKAYRKHFTYELEERNYRDRPYPITGQAFEEIPFAKFFLGPVGRLIKPARLMHVDEWARINSETGSLELKHTSNSLDIQPAYSLGGLKPGNPDSPYSSGRQLGQFWYQNLVEGPGLWGFTFGSMGERFAGVDVPGMQGNTLASANSIDSWTRRYWEANLGGFGFLSEPVRRFFPRPMSSLQQYNPIPNNMPSWMPEELRFGDPYSNVTGGEYRLPGKGYAALHPELEGKDPETWPLVYKYSILSDVAAWSTEFREVERSVKFRMKNGMLSDDALEFVQAAEARMQQKRMKREWQSYLPQLNAETKRQGIVGRAAGAAWKGFNEVLHDMFSGPSKLIPLGFRPVEKLFKYLDPISEYEDTVVYGTRFAFWGLKEGWRDWVRPFINQTVHDWFGADFIPSHLKEIRAFNEHYDQLEFYKWKSLEEQARAEGDGRKANLYKKMARRTVTGVNPFDRLATVKAALPREEQDFFEAFAAETDERRRAEILELVPESTHHLYEAQWLKTDYLRTGDKDLGKLIQDWGSTAGEDYSRAQWARYSKEAPNWMTYGDFHKLRNVEMELGDRIPAADWVGFNPAVDIQDVKMRVVQQQGGDIHDFGMWDSQARMLSRKPYLTDEVVSQGSFYHSDEGSTNLKSFAANGLDVVNSRTLTYNSQHPSHTLDIEVQDSRHMEEERFRKTYGL